jgi:integrase
MMPKLTDLSLKNLAAPPRGQVTYDDEGTPLKVRVSQGGTKTFIILIGSGRRHTIGRYGDITLQQARAAAVRLKAEKTLGRTFPEIISLEAARAEYLSQITVRANTREYYVRHLGKLKGPRLTDVTPRDINRILDPLPIPSRMQALASFRPFFNWCVGRSYLDRSPCERLTAQPSPARDRVLSAVELKSIWEATVEPKPYNGIVRILMLTGQRKGEIAALQRAWIKNGMITLPKEVTKNAREHVLPVGSLCAAELARCSKTTHSQTGHVFSEKASAGAPSGGWSKCKIALDRKLGDRVAPWTLHDLRRTFATNLAALGTPIQVTEKLLNHISGTVSGVAAIYNRHAYLDEMRAAIDAWEKRLSFIIAQHNSDDSNGSPLP